MNILQLNPPKPSIFFMHLPKTGGTSVDAAFQKHYRNRHVHIKAPESYKAAENLYNNPHEEFTFNDCFHLREGLVAYQMNLGSQYISGHVPFNRKIWEAHKDNYSYVTILRHPVKRFISNFFFNKYNKSDHCSLTDSLSEFLSSDRGQAWGHMYTDYFAGSEASRTKSVEELVKIAKDNASKFNTVGFLESLDDFISECKNKYNLRLRIPHKRRNPKTKQKLSQAELEKVNHICRFDLELYNFLKS